jgi:hypothetical protein
MNENARIQWFKILPSATPDNKEVSAVDFFKALSGNATVTIELRAMARPARVPKATSVTLLLRPVSQIPRFATKFEIDRALHEIAPRKFRRRGKGEQKSGEAFDVAKRKNTR